MSKADQFEDFHVKNPWVYDAMCMFSREWIARGGTTIGVDMVLGRARWEIALPTTDAEFRIRNDFKPFYARLLMYREDDLAWLFTTRNADVSGADEWIKDYARRNPRDSKWFDVWVKEREAEEQ